MKTNIIKIIKSLATALPIAVLAMLFSSSCSESLSQNPKILIFYIDDMGYAQPSSYGGKLISTPNIDMLAKNGISFTNGYVSSPICSPSRVGLLTGRYQARTGHDANGGSTPGRELDTDEVTMAELLKQQGYTTGIVGKWHIGETELKHLPLARGFDFYIGHAGNINEKGGRGYIRGNESVEFPEHPITSETWANESIRFINENKDKPFFFTLHLMQFILLLWQKRKP